MIRNHLRHLHHRIDDQSLPTRGTITLAAVAALPLLGTGVRMLGRELGLGAFTYPLLVLVHVPIVVALIAIWSIGCDLCKTQ